MVGLRPEDIQPAQSGLTARVRLIEQTGAESHVLLDFGGETLTVVLHGRPSLHDNDMIHISIPFEKLHFFDEETGERIQVPRA